MSDRPTAQHDASGNRFFVEVEGGTAYLAYRMRDAYTLDALSTFTPPEARGQGLAAIVTRAALDHARAEGLRVVPSCWYVDGFMVRNEEYADLRA